MAPRSRAATSFLRCANTPAEEQKRLPAASMPSFVSRLWLQARWDSIAPKLKRTCGELRQTSRCIVSCVRRQQYGLEAAGHFQPPDGLTPQSSSTQVQTFSDGSNFAVSREPHSLRSCCSPMLPHTPTKVVLVLPVAVAVSRPTKRRLAPRPRQESASCSARLRSVRSTAGVRHASLHSPPRRPLRSLASAGSDRRPRCDVALPAQQKRVGI